MRFAILAGMIVAAAVLPPTAGVGQSQAQESASGDVEVAVFAGGCFWCMEEAFDAVEGVIETTSGYTGGTVANPSYEQVVAGATGHAEAVVVRYDRAKVSYSELLTAFWRNIDPFDTDGQFCDRGDSYRSAIFVANDEQKRLAEASKAALADRLDEAIVTEVTEASDFYPAEGYHQGYYKRNPLHYKFYKWNCGRAQRLEQIWGKPDGR